jgi:hypothetical protein
MGKITAHYFDELNPAFSLNNPSYHAKPHSQDLLIIAT